MDEENKSSLISDSIRSENLLLNGYYNINGKLLEKKINWFSLKTIHMFIKELVAYVFFIYLLISISYEMLKIEGKCEELLTIARRLD